MTRALIIMAGAGAVAGAAGVTTLVRPSIARRITRLPDTEPTTYALRIAGMMLAALGLFLTGFAAMGMLAEGAA